LPARQVDTLVGIARRAKIALVAEVTHPRIARLVFPADHLRLICRRIIADDQFEITKSLRQEGIDGLADVPLAVSNWHSDGNSRRFAAHVHSLQTGDRLD